MSVVTVIAVVIAIVLLIRAQNDSAKIKTLIDAQSRAMAEAQNQALNYQEARMQSLEAGLAQMRNENNKQLDDMRKVVDTQLQTTLENRIGHAFARVNEELAGVNQGIGEMKKLAVEMGDLRKMLTNVKSRGVFGEVQLHAILDQMLDKSQYVENYVIYVDGKKKMVEFAVKMPGSGSEPVYLPIDAKFPGDTYLNLVDAYEAGDKAEIEIKKTALRRRIVEEASDISEKYIVPPQTTDFAIMFLPFEGLYAEVLNLGMLDELSKKYKVTIAGPTTMAAILNSLQMGFKMAAIEKKSDEVWRILEGVRKEFETFGDALTAAQKKIREADEKIDYLVTTRTNQMRKQLRNISLISDEEAEKRPEN